MNDLFLSTALLPDGWARDVRLRIAPDGLLSAVESGASPSGAERVAGVGVPGLPNVHSHAFQRALAGRTERGTAGEDSFWTWRRRMYEFLAVLTPDDIGAVAAQLFTELLRHGFTSVAEFHYLRNAPDGASYDEPAETALAVLQAARRTGMGLTLLPAVYVAGGFGDRPLLPAQRRFHASADDVLRDLERIARAQAGGGDAGIGLALHSLRAVPPEQMQAAVEGFRSMAPGAPVHVHVAEQTAEVDACVAWCGRRPVRWLLDHAPVSEQWCLVHATHVDATELQDLARSGAVVGLCPTTEANLGDGLFPFSEYLAHGGGWAVGTDSHVGRSPAGELRLLEYGQRLLLRRRNVAALQRDTSTGRVLLEGALAGGRRATGLRVGALQAGSRADLVVLDSEHPTLAGLDGDDLLDGWIFSGDDSPVRHVMTGGVWRVRDGRHLLHEEVAGDYRGLVRRLSQA